MLIGILFHFLCAQHVSDINISIIRNFATILLNITFVVLFLVRCLLEFWCGWFGAVSILQARSTSKFLMMDILMPETC